MANLTPPIEKGKYTVFLWSATDRIDRHHQSVRRRVDELVVTIRVRTVRGLGGRPQAQLASNRKRGTFAPVCYKDF